MIMLEVCGAVELYCHTEKDVSVIKPIHIDMNRVDKIIEKKRQYNAPVPNKLANECDFSFP